MSAATAPAGSTVPATRASRSIAVRRRQGHVVVLVRGGLDAAGATMVEHILVDLIDGQGNRNLVLDLTETDVRDPIAFAALRSVAEQARRRGAAFVVELPAARPAG